MQRHRRRFECDNLDRSRPAGRVLALAASALRSDPAMPTPQPGVPRTGTQAHHPSATGAPAARRGARLIPVVAAVCLLLGAVCSAGGSASPAGAEGIIDIVDFSPPRDHIGACLPGLAPAPRPGGVVMGISYPGLPHESEAWIAPVLASAPNGLTMQLWAAYRSADPVVLQQEIDVLEADVAFWEAKGYRLTLTIAYRTTENLVEGYARFVSDVLTAVGPHIERVYVTNEANLPGSPGTSDGSSPGVLGALIAGVVAADTTATSLNLQTQIGFKVAATILDEPFWDGLAAGATPQFRAAIDIVGVDLYPTPFTAQPDLDIAGFVIGNLALLRGCRLPSVGLAHASFDVTEAGVSHYWFQPPDQAALVLRTMIRTAYDYSGSLDIIGWTQWALFCDLAEHPPTTADIPGDLIGCTGIINSTTDTPLPGFDVFAEAAARNGAVEPPPPSSTTTTTGPESMTTNQPQPAQAKPAVPRFTG